MSNLELCRKIVNAGAPYEVALDIDTPLTITSVSAAIVDKLEEGCEATVITSVLSLTDRTGGRWSAVMAASETAKLLTDATDTSSPLRYFHCQIAVYVEYQNAYGESSARHYDSIPVQVGRALIA